MGLPFNFFGFTPLPFILQGSFLFGDDWALDWNWSGSWTGISPDYYHINFDWSGEYEKDVDPERYTIDWKWSGRFSGVHDEFIAHAFNPSGEYTGILTEAAFLYLNTTGEYIRERQDDFYIGNTLDHVEMKPMNQNHFNFTFKVPKIKIYQAYKENLTLASEVPKITFSSESPEAHFVDETYTYSVKLNGIYQKAPAS